jgi:hypothetical protein
MNLRIIPFLLRKKSLPFFPIVLACLLLFTTACHQAPAPIRVGVFRVDATPPIGSPVAYAPARSIVDSLSARGIVILSDEKPVVLCAVDWLGIANEGQERWKESLAKAANTIVDRVSVHEHHVAVTMDELQIMRGEGDDIRVYIEATQEQLEAQPEYKGD